MKRLNIIARYKEDLSWTKNLKGDFLVYNKGEDWDYDLPKIDVTNYGREAHRYLQCYIPLNNKKIHYNDGGSDPKFFDIGFALIAYDSWGSLTTDNICSYAWERKFYFKDP